MKILCDCGATLVDAKPGVALNDGSSYSISHTCGCKATWFLCVSPAGIRISNDCGVENASIRTQGTPDAVIRFFEDKHVRVQGGNGVYVYDVNLYPAGLGTVLFDSPEMIEGETVEVRLHGNDTWKIGIVLDRPRKMWVQLDGMIADENSIAEWRRR